MPDTSPGSQHHEALSHSHNVWSLTSLHDRLRVIASLRTRIAENPERLTNAISRDLPRHPADTLAAEVLPLLAACRFLETDAPRVLRSRRLGRGGRPAWLPGVSHRVERVPLGRVFVIGPGNYPLFLPGVQVLQALAAGNTAIWKPGRGGEPVALALAAMLAESGLPAHALTVTDESIEAAGRVISSGVDKVVLTGSAETGRAVLRQAAETLTPVVAELSGCDSVIVLPDADLRRVTEALTFGMRLNGSATCMAPRRVLLVNSAPARTLRLIEMLRSAFASVPGIPLPAHTSRLLRDLLEEALAHGATTFGKFAPDHQQPILVTGATPALRVTQTDLFAPVLTLLDVADEAGALAAEAASPFALTCAVFGDPRRARALAGRLHCGTVVLNDLIAPTADPRVPFGGRRRSGFGVTRGAEGLLEMTAIRVITTRAGRSTRHFERTGPAHESLFRAVARLLYAGTWRSRLTGARALGRAARNLAGLSKPRNVETPKDPS